MKMINIFRHLVLISLLLFLTACINDSDNGGGSSELAGDWYGTMEDSSLIMHTLSVSVNSDNSITSIYADGTNIGLSGTIAVEPSAIGAKLYNFVLSDATEGGFFADPSLTYIAYIDSDGNFGVLQKSAVSLPSYASSDIAGNWSGYSVELDSALNLTDEYTSSAAVNISGYFTSVDAYGTSTGSFDVPDTSFGRYTGTYVNAYESGNVHAFLSADKQFAATWACWSSWPSNCSFSAWTK
ncbi:MAG: hypothetical protein OQL09_07015 [Gammaproteobacteria bacterium]|nr:hypothetical protein [Gammaproteobacteria bacterium]